jgi:hypothetical protein
MSDFFDWLLQVLVLVVAVEAAVLLGWFIIRLVAET